MRAHEQADPHRLDLLPAALPGADDQRHLPAVLEGRRRSTTTRSTAGSLVASYSRERGAILVGRNPVAESVKSDDEYKFQRTYPKPLQYAPLTGYFSYFGATGIERSPQRRALRRRLAAVRHQAASTCSATTRRKGGNVTLTIDPAAQQAAYDGLKALGADVQGAVVALEPSTGKVLAMVSLPTYDPNKLASHDLGVGRRDLDTAQRRPGRAAAQPGDPDPAAPRLDVQGRDRRGGDREGPLRRRLRGARRRDLPAPADQRPDRRDRQRGPQLRCQRRQDPVHARRWSSPATPPSPQIAERGRRRGHGQDRRGLRLQRALLRRPVPPGAVGLPRPTSTRRSSARPASASSTCRRPRCRWRWSRPASPTAAA